MGVRNTLGNKVIETNNDKYKIKASVLVLISDKVGFVGQREGFTMILTFWVFRRKRRESVQQ